MATSFLPAHVTRSCMHACMRCSSKTTDNCGKVKGEGEHEPVLEGASESDENDKSGPVDKEAAPLPAQLVVARGESDESDDGVKAGMKQKPMGK
jgi:MoaA/NifB/PqqE/SkfB family radical SAM enzyme